MLANRRKKDAIDIINKRRKIVIFGDSHTGKTALVERLINNAYFEKKSTTKGASCSMTKCEIDNVNLNIDLIDTSGSTKYQNVARCYYQKANYFIGVFDLTSLSSLTKLHEEISFIRQHYPVIPIILIGTKYDLRDSIKVSDKSIEGIKYRHGIIEHYLVSAKMPLLGNNISNVFNDIAHKLSLTEELSDSSQSADYLLRNIQEFIAKERRQLSLTRNLELLLNAAESVVYHSNAILAKIKNIDPIQEHALEQTLKRVYDVIVKPTSQLAINSLKHTIDTLAPGHSVLWKKLIGAMLIVTGVACIIASGVAIPFSAGLSGIGFIGGSFAIISGFLLFRSGTQTKVAEYADRVANVAKVNFISR